MLLLTIGNVHLCVVYRRATGILARDGAALVVLGVGQMSELVERRLATGVESIPLEPDQRSNLRREAPVSPIHASPSQGGVPTMNADEIMPFFLRPGSDISRYKPQVFDFSQRKVLLTRHLSNSIAHGIWSKAFQRPS